MPPTPLQTHDRHRRSLGIALMALAVLTLAACGPLKTPPPGPAPGPPPPPRPPPPPPVTVTFQCAQATEQWTVPAGIAEVTVDAYGAQGGGPKNNNAGGLGGHAHAVLAVTPGETLDVRVGCQGSLGMPGGFPDGGDGGPSNGFIDGSGGGGSSDVTQNGNRVGVAGGPGGGGGWHGGGGATGRATGGTCGAGEGSGRVPPGGTMQSGVRAGDGLVVMSY